MIWVDIGRAAVALNAVLLLVLVAIWSRNYAQFRSKHVLGLLIFAVFLLFQNVFTLYYYLVDPKLSVWFATEMPAIAWRVLMGVHVLESVALVFLVWVTWD